MRIDKYLWCVRYYKTRNMATNACKKGHVKLNDVVVKASREVYASDSILLRKNKMNYSLEVLAIPTQRVAAKLVDLYRKDTTPKENYKTQELVQLSQSYYRKNGTGKPSKKDRRDITTFWEENED